MKLWIIASILFLVCLVTSALGESPKPPPPDFYALYCWSDGCVKYAGDLQKVGIRWLRVGDFSAAGDQADKALLVAAKNGMQLVPVLGVPGIGHGKSMDAEQAVAKMRDVTRRTVQRYGPGGQFWKEHPEADASSAIRYWQIWNEPNIEFLTPPNDPNGILRSEFYAMLLKAASEEIRKLDPGARIIGFNTAGGAWDIDRSLKPDSMYQKLKYIGWRKFIRDVAAITGPDAFDAVGLHPYTQPQSAESGNLIQGLEKLSEIAKEGKFERKPVWFTEVGFAVVYPNKKNVRDERQQACFTTRLFALAAAHGVTQVQVMYIEDIVYGPDRSERNFGFFTAPGKWREQATATQIMLRLIPDPRKNVKILSEKEKGVYAYRFQGAGKWPVHMAWTDGAAPVEQAFYAGDGKPGEPSNGIPLLDATPDSTITVVDMLGEVSTAKIEGGKLKRTLTEAPVYLIPAPREEVEKILKK